MWGPIITDEEARSIFVESPSLELLTPGANLLFDNNQPHTLIEPTGLILIIIL